MIPSLLHIPNIRYFVMFRVCYFARFYYPIMTLLYLDYGLTLSQFALLNAIWAATIVISEVPSGAFADLLGRKKLVVLSSIVMFVEIALIAFVPTGDIELVFWVFFINRILSGLAMALSSGADEALAFDTVKQLGREEEWPQILQTLIRVSSTVSIFVTIIGAAMYDLDVMKVVFQFLALGEPLSTQDIMRIPVYATLIVAGLALYAALKMEEDTPTSQNHDALNASGNKIMASLTLTMQTAKWITTTPVVLFTLLYYSIFEQVSRMFLTLNSQYYRAIEIPIIYIGFIGAGVSLFKIIVAGQSRRLAEGLQPAYFLLLMGVLSMASYFFIGQGYPIYGVIPALVLIFLTMTINIFISFHLNKLTKSENRATVLSFKGLMFNIGYGSIGVLYAYYYGIVSKRFTPDEVANDFAFLESLPSFFYYFTILFSLIVVVHWFNRRMKL
ncbi:MFS transporter [Vibrio sp.]|nr:MFS transporter [Vibrio sp.]